MHTRFGLAFERDLNRAAVRYLRAGKGLDAYRLALDEVWDANARRSGYAGVDYVEV